MSESLPQNFGESNKLIYKEMSDLGRQIDVAGSKCHSISDLFASEILGMRYKFREACETLLCGSPQFYGRVVREKLWRHAYYDVICRARRIVKDRDWDALSIAYITQHLFHGIGHLNVVLMKLEEIPEFKKVNFPFSPNGISNILADEPSLQREDGEDSLLTEPPKWLNDLVYIICINIGDLYRYLTDIHSKRDQDQAESYFNRAKDYYSQITAAGMEKVLDPASQDDGQESGQSGKRKVTAQIRGFLLKKAFVLFPDAGLATNQIGNLSVKLNGGIDTTYYMLHSMLSTIAYEGAPSNLQHHLSNCLVRFATLPGTHESKPIEVFCNSFLTQIHHFLYENVNITNFGKGIADLILNFQERLATYDPDLDERFLFRISSICVLTFWQLQAQNSPNISLAVAFATAMFSQLLTQLGLILEQHSHLERIVAQIPSPSPSESFSTVQVPEETGELTTDAKYNEKTNIVEISGEIAVLNIQTQDTNASNEKVEKPTIRDGEERDGEKQLKKKKNVLALRRRRRVFKNMIPTSSSDESDQELSDGSFVGSNNDEDDSADSDYGWSSNSDSNFSVSEMDMEDAESQSGRCVVVKNRQSSRAFGSSSSSNSRSDTSGHSGPAIISKTVFSGDPSKLEFASGKTSTQSNCSNGVGDCDMDSEYQNMIEIGNTTSEKFVIGLDELKKCRTQFEPLLVAVLPFVRWLQVSPEIKDAFAANCGKEYVVGMCNMFNLLGSQNWSKILEDVGSKVRNDWRALGGSDLKTEKLFRWQLPEDRSMLGLPRYGTCVSDLKSGCTLNENELLVTRMGRIILFGYWLMETKSFSMDYDETKQEFRYESPKNERRRERENKIRSLMDLDPGIDALTKAYRAGGNPDSRPRRGKGRDRERERGQGRERRRTGGRKNQRQGADRNKNSDSVVFIVVDLPAVLYNLKNVKKLANKRRFVVVLPRPVWKAIDDLKTTKDDGSEEARIASEWLKICAADGHRGVRCLRDHEKMPIDCAYPKTLDAETTEFFIMMETCKYLLAHYRDEKPSSRTFFGDMRDKFRVICLSGYRGMLSPNSGKEFNPISVARLVGTFVDVVTSYPPNHGRKKWKSSKSNG